MLDPITAHADRLDHKLGRSAGLFLHASQTQSSSVHLDKPEEAHSVPACPCCGLKLLTWNVIYPRAALLSKCSIPSIETLHHAD